MAFLELEDFRLYHEVHGTGPAIVFAHGAGGNHVSWWQQVPALTDRYTCVVFDHRGFGRSVARSPVAAPDRFVADLSRLVDHLGLEQVTLVGQSMGGWTSLGYAAAHPERVRGVVLASTPGGLDTADIRAGLAAASVRRQAVEASGIDPAAGERMIREQPAMAFLYAEIRRLNPRLERGGLLDFLNVINRTTPEQAERIRCPTLFITGNEDAIFPTEVIEKAAALVPDAVVERVWEAGHSIYFERPTQFNRILTQFLDRTGR